MNKLLAATLDGSLSGIVTKISELMNSFWIYIILAMAAVVVVWAHAVTVVRAVARIFV